MRQSLVTFTTQPSMYWSHSALRHCAWALLRKVIRRPKADKVESAWSVSDSLQALGDFVEITCASIFPPSLPLSLVLGDVADSYMDDDERT